MAGMGRMLRLAACCALVARSRTQEYYGESELGQTSARVAVSNSTSTDAPVFKLIKVGTSLYCPRYHQLMLPCPLPCATFL